MLVLPLGRSPYRLVAHIIGQGQVAQALISHALGQRRTEGRGEARPLAGRWRLRSRRHRRDGKVVGGGPSVDL